MRREILAGLVARRDPRQHRLPAHHALVGVLEHLRTRTGCSSRSPSPISLVGVVLWGTLSGSLLPFLLKRLGFDPATSSAPFVATLVDVTGLVIYFSVALVVLKGTLL